MPLDSNKNTLWDLECDQIANDVASELLRQAELRQEAEFRAALGMDQRAAVLAAGFIAAGGAAAAAALALSGHGQLRLGALVGSFMFGVAAALCGWACRPQKFRFPGLEPLDWGYSPAYLTKPLRELIMGRVAQLQDQVTENKSQQEKNGRILTAGMLFAAASPAVAVIISLAARALGWV